MIRRFWKFAFLIMLQRNQHTSVRPLQRKTKEFQIAPSVPMDVGAKRIESGILKIWMLITYQHGVKVERQLLKTAKCYAKLIIA